MSSTLSWECCQGKRDAVFFSGPCLSCLLEPCPVCLRSATGTAVPPWTPLACFPPLPPCLLAPQQGTIPQLFLAPLLPGKQRGGFEDTFLLFCLAEEPVVLVTCEKWSVSIFRLLGTCWRGETWGEPYGNLRLGCVCGGVRTCCLMECGGHVLGWVWGTSMLCGL